MATTKTSDQLNSDFRDWSEVQVVAIDAVGEELAMGNYAQAATLLERMVKGQATLAVMVRNEANRIAGLA